MLGWAAVYLYGLLLTAAFLNLPFSKKGLCAALVQFSLCMAAQYCLELFFGYKVVEMAYPLLCHLPIVLMAVFYYKTSPLAAATAMLAAYLLTIPRNLIGELVALLCIAPYAKEITKIIITIPLILLIFKYVLPLIRRVLLRPRRELWLFLTPALTYYVMIYITSVYTDLAYTGSFAVMSLLATLLCLCTFIYVFMDYSQLAKNSHLRQQKQIIDLQSSETALRLEEISYSQLKTKTLRHDLRHYLQIINDYAASGNTEAVGEYIRSLQAEIDDTVVQQYCKNESVNLILSSYAGKVKRQGAALSVSASMPVELENELDVCIVLANGLENALHACAGLPESQIFVECNHYAGKAVIQIKNPYSGQVTFADGMPKSDRLGHGLGTLSIVSIAESHGGAADFSANDGFFTMRAVF